MSVLVNQDNVCVCGGVCVCVRVYTWEILPYVFIFSTLSLKVGRNFFNFFCVTDGMCIKMGGSPHPAKILPIPPPHLTLVPVFGPRLVPPPAEVCPRKFEKFKYIFVSNLTALSSKVP